MRKIDEVAQKIALGFGMPLELHIPIAARSIEAIDTYIGTTSRLLASSKSGNALLVKLDEPPYRNSKIAIWKVKGADILKCPRQVWVHVSYNDYRKAYHIAFPEQDLSNMVIDHIMNRRIARLKGFDYLRITPISREANSSSGNMTEKYGFEYHSSEQMKLLNSQNQSFIQFGDIADIVKMLNIKTGGSFQEGVNEALKYLSEV